MIQHEVSIHLNQPVEQVFAFLMDTGKLSTWQSNLIKTELLTEGPLRLGSRFREVRRLGRRESEIQGEITAFEPNKRFETSTLTKPQVTVSYSFEAENGGTRLKHKFVMLTGGLMRLFEPLIANSIKKESESDFETLKRILEN
ncbi:MAG TPA: SRPBCC family protein [Anaerolineales bacterium]|nr:SRPBCC family protein [Anaerolineales bacterium]